MAHLLAELALARADALLSDRGLRFKRYIDDYHIYADSEEAAQAALFDVAELLYAELGLSLNRMKTSIDPAEVFVVEARRRAREDAQGDHEEALLAAIKEVTDSDYDFTTLEEVLKHDEEAVSEEAIEALLEGELSSGRVDYPRLGWLLRRLSQVEAPGGLAFVLRHFEEFVPVIGDTVRYLARAGRHWKESWEQLGERILTHADNPIAVKSPYVQTMLFSLFAECEELDHLGQLLKRFSEVSAPARRELILAAKAGGSTDWIHAMRHEATRLDPWAKRAFLHAATDLPAPQQEDCLTAVEVDARSGDSILVGVLLADRDDLDVGTLREPKGPAWAALRAQVPRARRPLVDRRFESLGDALEAEVYGAVGDDRLLVATWNLRNFGGGVFGFSDRMPESLRYIARVILAFDLVAIQEVRDKALLDRLSSLLGPGWNKVVGGEAPGREGNSEMSAFLFRPSRVSFLGEVEQVVLGKRDLILGQHQFARPPFVANFDVGGARLTTCTAHAYFGATRGPKLDRRIAEITALAKLIVRRTKKERATAMLLGDLNVVAPNHPTMAPLERYELSLPGDLLIPTNVKGDKFYTQIAFKPTLDGPRLRRSGVVRVFDQVLRTDDSSCYRVEMETSKAWETASRRRNAPTLEDFFETWRTFQLSDHLPVWVELAL